MMMRCLRLLWSGGKTVAYALACWMVLFSAALAKPQETAKPEPDTGDSVYVWCYGLVILGVTLGMLFVCRSSNRRDRARPEHYGETKTKLTEEE
jgi:hypothetical protein